MKKILKFLLHYPLVTLSILVYLSSFMIKTYYDSKTGFSYEGIWVFLNGMLFGRIWGYINLFRLDLKETWPLIWEANPLYILAIIYYYRGKKKAIIFSMAAVIIALLFLFTDRINSESDFQVGRIYLGFYIWLSSFVILFFSLAVPFIIQMVKNLKWPNRNHGGAAALILALACLDAGAQVTARVEYPYNGGDNGRWVFALNDLGAMSVDFSKHEKSGMRYFREDFFSTDLKLLKADSVAVDKYTKSD